MESEMQSPFLITIASRIASRSCVRSRDALFCLRLAFPFSSSSPPSPFSVHFGRRARFIYRRRSGVSATRGPLSRQMHRAREAKQDCSVAPDVDVTSFRELAVSSNVFDETINRPAQSCTVSLTSATENSRFICSAVAPRCALYRF